MSEARRVDQGCLHICPGLTAMAETRNPNAVRRYRSEILAERFHVISAMPSMIDDKVNAMVADLRLDLTRQMEEQMEHMRRLMRLEIEQSVTIRVATELALIAQEKPR